MVHKIYNTHKYNTSNTAMTKALLECQTISLNTDQHFMNLDQNYRGCICGRERNQQETQNSVIWSRNRKNVISIELLQMQGRQQTKVYDTLHTSFYIVIGARKENLQEKQCLRVNISNNQWKTISNVSMTLRVLKYLTKM